MTIESIPFLDLVTPHGELEAELLEVARKAFRTAGFIGGPMVEGFERAFAEFCETRYCIGVGSGTDALRFAIVAAGIGPGDAVVTVPNTFIATAEARRTLPQGIDRFGNRFFHQPTKFVACGAGAGIELQIPVPCVRYILAQRRHNTLANVSAKVQNEVPNRVLGFAAAPPELI